MFFVFPRFLSKNAKNPTLFGQERLFSDNYKKKFDLKIDYQQSRQFYSDDNVEEREKFWGGRNYGLQITYRGWADRRGI